MLTYIQANHIVKALKTYVKDLYVVGSYRRKENEINDLDFVTKIPLTYMSDRLTQYFMNSDLITKAQGERYMRIMLPCDYGDVYLDFWYARNDYEYFFMKTLLSMDKGHQIFYKKMAKKKGFKLSQYGLYKNGIRYDIPSLTKVSLNTILEIPQYPYSPQLSDFGADENV